MSEIFFIPDHGMARKREREHGPRRRERRREWRGIGTERRGGRNERVLLEREII